MNYDLTKNDPTLFKLEQELEHEQEITGIQLEHDYFN